MDNAVVENVTRHLRSAGVATLRFNFRGVGGSEGEYAEVAAAARDARAAVEALVERSGNTAVTLAGYSFGALAALLAATERVAGVVAIAPPLAMVDSDELIRTPRPTLLLAGDCDPYCPPDVLQGFARRMAEQVCVEPIAGADHFLFGFEDAIGARVGRFVLEGLAVGKTGGK